MQTQGACLIFIRLVLQWFMLDALLNSIIFQIVIEAIRGNNYQGDIAIDDVSVTANCPAPREYTL